MHRIVPTTRTLRGIVPASLAAGVLAVGLLGPGAVAAPTSPQSAPVASSASRAAEASGGRVGRAVTTSALLTVEDVRAAGLEADSATITATGDATLNDGGHYDESCLPDKTIRAITGAKSYPARGTGQGYADGEWASTLDKEVSVTESVAQGRSVRDTDRYVALLTSQITHVQDCQEDPAQGVRHAPVRHVRAGDATGAYYATVYPDGSRDGGGVAVVRDGTRFGIVSVSSGHDRSSATLKKLAKTAAARLR